MKKSCDSSAFMKSEKDTSMRGTHGSPVKRRVVETGRPPGLRSLRRGHAPRAGRAGLAFSNHLQKPTQRTLSGWCDSFHFLLFDRMKPRAVAGRRTGVCHVSRRCKQACCQWFLPSSCLPNFSSDLLISPYYSSLTKLPRERRGHMTCVVLRGLPAG